MLLQVAAGTRLRATTAEVNMTYTASVAAVASTTAAAVSGSMADIACISLQSIAVWCGPALPRSASKPPRYPGMARLESQPLVEALGIDAGMMRQQFDQLAAPYAGFRDRPPHHLLADAAAAARRGDANVLDQAARGALRAQSGQDAELQAADHATVVILRHHELDIRITFECLERPEIARRQRV